MAPRSCAGSGSHSTTPANFASRQFGVLDSCEITAWSSHSAFHLVGNTMSLEHVVAIVTGAASGLGRATSTRLVQQGARVVLCDLLASQGAQVAEELGENARFIPTDVVNEEDIIAALDLAESAFGRSVNVAVNCAGIALYGETVDANFETHSMEVFRRTLEVNTTGSFQVARLAAQRMAKQQPNDRGERGVIIHTASILGNEGTVGRVAYAASKAAVIGMTLPMARDLGDFGIRVVSVAPGGLDTPLFGQIPPELLDVYSKDIAFPKRLGRPEEIDHAVQFIIENPLINGETVRLDGGVRVGPGK